MQTLTLMSYRISENVAGVRRIKDVDLLENLGPNFRFTLNSSLPKWKRAYEISQGEENLPPNSPSVFGAPHGGRPVVLC